MMKDERHASKKRKGAYKYYVINIALKKYMDKIYRKPVMEKITYDLKIDRKNKRIIIQFKQGK